CQLSFDRKQFNSVIPWLEANREELSILVHGLTGNNLKDHTDGASWLGAEVPLNLSVFGA
ncbi:MAG: DOPA 4,5-dioxygenase family protein, partial [Cyanobacteria bacterium P01_E01_bin.34]